MARERVNKKELERLHLAKIIEDKIKERNRILAEAKYANDKFMKEGAEIKPEDRISLSDLFKYKEKLKDIDKEIDSLENKAWNLMKLCKRCSRSN